jgi:hypothetical protein
VQVHHLHQQATTSKSNQRTAAYDFLQLHPLGVLLGDHGPVPAAVKGEANVRLVSD